MARRNEVALALRELEAPSGTAPTVFLAFFAASIAGEQPSFA
jgi:hypothetical protein